jgi:hypothetical protein
LDALEGNGEDDSPVGREEISDEEALDQAFPFSDYGRGSARVKALVALLEEEYDRREKVIDRIMKYRTGIESRKALRACPIPVLGRWEASLKGSRIGSLDDPL